MTPAAAPGEQPPQGQRGQGCSKSDPRAVGGATTRTLIEKMEGMARRLLVTVSVVVACSGSCRGVSSASAGLGRLGGI